MNRWKLLVVLIASLPLWTATHMSGKEAGSFRDPSPTSALPTDENAAPRVDLVTVEEVKTMLARNQTITIIDVRSTESFADSENLIKGSIHFKLRKLRSRLRFPPLKDLPRDAEIVTYCACADDKASIRAAQILMQGGFKRVRALKGGWTAWVNARGPMQSRMKPRH